MRYNINAELGVLASDLLIAGYCGEIKITNNGATGTVAMFKDSFIAMELSGFCKETLYIAWDTVNRVYTLIGRYDHIADNPTVPTVKQLTDIAWLTYKRYKHSKGYGRPGEWDALFKQYGYLTTKVVEQVVESD